MEDQQTTGGTQAPSPSEQPAIWWDGYRWRAASAPLASSAQRSGAAGEVPRPEWWWDGYQWRPWPGQWPAVQAPPGAQSDPDGPQSAPVPGQVSPTRSAHGAGPVFGVTPLARPGQVPWTWRDVLFGLLVAVGPIAALTFLSLISGSGSGDQPRTLSYGVFAAILTLAVDGWYVLWAWFFSLRKYSLSWRSYGFKGFEEGKAWAIAAGVIVCGIFATTLVSAASDAVYRRVIGPVPSENVVTLFPHVPAGLLLFLVFGVVLVPPLEELIFRGFVFQGLARSWGPVAGAIVSALVFALAHQQLSVLVPIFFLGVLLAAAFYWTRSLYANIAMHATFNLIGVVAWWLLR